METKNKFEEWIKKTIIWYLNNRNFLKIFQRKTMKKDWG